MKTHAAMEQPPNIGEDPEAAELATFILWQFLQMPAGGLYAKWDADAASAKWFYSHERDFMFREPRCDLLLYEENNRARFRSVVFRLGTLVDDGLCGTFKFQRSGSAPRRCVVHASFYPDARIGLWLAMTSMDES